jgi:two-component system, NtrC family, sensor kinase
VLTNLAVNAVRATPSGGRVTLVAATGDEGSVILTVDDDGPGIAPDDVLRLLSPFATGEAAGTGLGLAIVTELVALHGGDLALERRPEGGTRARVTLPDAAVDAMALQ